MTGRIKMMWIRHWMSLVFYKSLGIGDKYRMGYRLRKLTEFIGNKEKETNNV